MSKRFVLLSVIGIALIAVPLSAEIPDTLWTATFGGAMVDSAYTLCQCADGGFMVVGHTNSAGAGGFDIYLVKTDAEGNFEWDKTYGDVDNDYGYYIIPSSHGGFIISGSIDRIGAWDAYLVKIDTDGNVEWENTYGGVEFEYAMGLVQADDGGYVFTGTTWSSSETSQIWLVKVDSAGNEEWSKEFGGTDYDYGVDLVETADGGFIISGYGYAGTEDGYEGYLVKTDSDGNEVWSELYGGPGTQHFHMVRELASGDYVVTGYSQGSGPTADDLWFVKVDATGGLLWDKIYGGDGTDEGNSICVTETGFYVIGRTGSFGEGNADLWILETDEAGDTLSTMTLGGALSDGGIGAGIVEDSNIIIAGWTASFGQGSISDFWLLKLGYEEEPGVAESVTPSVIISTSLNRLSWCVTGGEATLSLYSADGRKVLEENLEGRGIISPDLHSGVYFARVRTAGISQIEKLVIIR